MTPTVATRALTLWRRLWTALRADRPEHGPKTPKGSKRRLRGYEEIC